MSENMTEITSEGTAADLGEPIFIRNVEQEVLGLITALPLGVVAMDADGNVVYANRAGRAFLEWSGSVSSRGRRERPLAALFSMHRGGERAWLGKTYVGHRLAVDGGSVFLIGTQPPRIDPAVIVEVHGVGKRAAEMVSLLCDGLDLAAAASEMGIGYETVRKHLKHTFELLDVCRQADLVRVVLSGPAPMLSALRGAKP